MTIAADDPTIVVASPEYYKELRTKRGSVSPLIVSQKETDDLLTIKKVVNGWILTIAPNNVPLEYAGGELETLVFNRLSDLFDALKIFYGED